MESGANLAGEMLVLEIPVKDPSFDLTNVVCSHGFFMMAPNQWGPASSTLQRPIRLPSGTVRVRISHPRPSGPVAVSVPGTSSLSFEDEQALLDQVRRMLRMSDDSDRFIQEFHRIHAGCRERGLGRIFRSPTLFEDMVKCILLCNCQWPRTLSMARALCELHLQLKQSCNSETSHPKTPQQREQKRKNIKRKKVAVKLEAKFTDGAEFLKTPNLMNNHITQPTDSCNSSSPSQSFNDELKFSEAIGDFPSPEELAPLDAAFLADCCKLGYRAQRIISLAQSIVDGTLKLRKLEELCEGYSLASYDSIDQKLSALSGFGPFTRANVLMCMGFYHRVPADTETVRHIRQFYGRNCDIKSVQEDIEVIYGKYAPFQFLAYWIELWGYYEGRFGTWSKLPASYYPLVTASNMKDRICKGLKVKKAEPEEQ
ncbi:uncharacterized protein LOC110028359 [Phalaenopsis equestris]|uniref:uncharacterized protein LOC110028359 n=1 Tax=Phalaenopsis equestris TaxID=78828 RepID=UPI0009E5DDBA|nr:uncharacterized protein LOC110028359 [Phalaenopsis equestris]XP_020585839.1 uncharacterized protein LOC110028359 [Phalaenopsis equestris]